jgi:hypothetical protein
MRERCAGALALWILPFGWVCRASRVPFGSRLDEITEVLGLGAFEKASFDIEVRPTAWSSG